MVGDSPTDGGQGQNMGSSHHCRRSCRIPAGQTAKQLKLRSWNSSKFIMNLWISLNFCVFCVFCLAFSTWLLPHWPPARTYYAARRSRSRPRCWRAGACGTLSPDGAGWPWDGHGIAMGLDTKCGSVAEKRNPGPTRPRGSARKRHDHPTQPETKVGSWRSQRPHPDPKGHQRHDVGVQVHDLVHQFLSPRLPAVPAQLVLKEW